MIKVKDLIVALQALDPELNVVITGDNDGPRNVSSVFESKIHTRDAEYGNFEDRVGEVVAKIYMD